MGATIGCPRRALQRTADHWERIVTALLNIRWLQRVFWAVGTHLQKVAPTLRERLREVDPALP